MRGGGAADDSNMAYGEKEGPLHMGCIKPNDGYSRRAYFCRALAALVALFPELDNKKKRSEGNKPPLTHGH